MEPINYNILDEFFKSINFDIDLLRDFKKIYVLVSGGHDSTLLAEYIYMHYPKTTYFVNCYNPYETSPTLTDFETRGLLVVKPNKQYNYSQILKDAFLKLNDAAELRDRKKYGKHVFGCCSIIKHKAFMADDLFKEEGSVVISGIKGGDGMQRRFWLAQLRYCKQTTKNTIVPDKPTFFYKHKGGQLYCYPLRDAMMREFPIEIMDEIKKIHPKIQHSGCAICPVLILFNDRIKSDDGDIRLNRSINYLRHLIIKGEFIPNESLLKYCKKINLLDFSKYII